MYKAFFFSRCSKKNVIKFHKILKYFRTQKMNKAFKRVGKFFLPFRSVFSTMVLENQVVTDRTAESVKDKSRERGRDEKDRDGELRVRVQTEGNPWEHDEDTPTSCTIRSTRCSNKFLRSLTFVRPVATRWKTTEVSESVFQLQFLFYLGSFVYLFFLLFNFLSYSGNVRFDSHSTLSRLITRPGI